MKNKIELKFIPNKKYETILYQYFKYFDINSTGLSSFHDFIKVNKRLGLVLNDYNNLEKIFLYFAEPETNFLLYKKFCENIFYFVSSNERNNIIKLNNIKDTKETFNDILTRKIMEKHGPFTLLELIKNLKIIDYENCNIIFFNDFIKALKRTEILLEEDEKIKIFEQCDYYINKNLHYNNMINILINQFWSEEKNDLCEEIFCSLTNNGKKCISINYFQKLLCNFMKDNNLLDFIEKYKLINKNNSLEPITLKEFLKLFKFFSFGDNKADFLQELNSAIKQNLNSNKCAKDSPSKKILNYNNNYIEKSPQKKEYNYSKSTQANNDIKDYNAINNNIINLIKKIKTFFMEYGRISLFNFIKQFKYYETNDNLINRNNFRKVFNNFNIKLFSEEIDSIFNEISVDYSKNYIYHEDFIKYFSVKCLNKRRDNIIKQVYDILLERKGRYIGELSIKYLKEEYNPKNNIFIKKEGDNYLDFIDCLEIYHFCYKGFKKDNFNKKEFVEFYRLISFLVNEDNDFIDLISNEWRIPKNILDNNFAHKEDIIPKKAADYFLLDLKNELKKLGVKGLLNLHLKFMSFCSNVSKITLNDFINIMNLNHIKFDINEFKDIFNYFSIDSLNEYLDYTSFIRFFKKELNETKLNFVEKVFSSLRDEYSSDKENIPINVIKQRYNAKRHPEVVSGLIGESEKIKEFNECFDINYEILNSKENIGEMDKLIDFDIFANFYEYVSFIYQGDNEFINLLESTWSE